MYSAEQILNGIEKYIDTEIIAQMPTTLEKVVVGAGITIAILNKMNVIKNLKENIFIKMLGIVDDGGMYDLDIIAKSLKINMEKYGNVTFSKLGRTLTFTPADIDKMKKCIEEAAK